MNAELLVAAAGMLILIIGIALTVVRCVRKCPPNHAMIITGVGASTGGSSYKIIIGGNAFVLPLVQQMNLINLSVHKTTAALSTVYSKDSIPICASATLHFKIIPTPIGIVMAAPALLGKTDDEMAAVVENIVERPFIAILQRLTAKELKGSYSDLADEIMKDSRTDLEKIGVELVSCTIRSIDEVYDRRHSHGGPP